MIRTACPGVAGTTVPAFVERRVVLEGAREHKRVAGTTVPAFVERGSPFSSSPSSHTGCRRDYGPGLR